MFCLSTETRRYERYKTEGTMATAEERQRPSLGRLLIGAPLATHDLPHQSVSKKVGLAVFASDAISYTAYATEEILLILAFAAGSAASFVAISEISLPIAFAIAVLLLIVILSYRQTIYAYPKGGGAYIVARDNLGQ